jgi:phosphate transport system permease protein
MTVDQLHWPKSPRGDSLVKLIFAAAAATVIVLLAALTLELYAHSLPTISKFGLSFFSGSAWDVTHGVFGALPYIFGTLVTSMLALVVGLPISLGVAIFLTEKLKTRRSIGTVIGTIIELLAAVPSVIYGLWGLLFFSPLLKRYVEIPLHDHLGFIPLFSGSPSGLDFFTAGILLAIMIIPTISAVSRDVLNAVPNSQREAMYALGGTDWEVIRVSVLPYARSGIFGATILGLGRAVGETMAVTMVAGNEPAITANLFSSGYTLSALIANQFTEATGTLYISALIEIGLILFVVALVINVFARVLIWRMKRGIHVRV